MFQYMLLLLEAALLIATAYIFWQTRRTAAEIADNAASPAVDAHNSVAQQAQAARMMHEVTDLVSELQSLSGATYQDFVRQKEELDQIVTQANTTIAELRNLVAQAETIPARYSPFLPDAPSEASAVAPASALPAPHNKITWSLALEEFNSYLANNDRTDNTIARANTHLRQFLNWRNGMNFENLPLSSITPSELDDYVDHLTEQPYQDSTVQRKLTALRTFIQWFETWSQNPWQPKPHAQPRQPQPETQPDLPSESLTSAPGPVPLSAGNRFKAVYALAEQGLDQSDIAARTGLEQEAVRMLLLVRSNSR